MSTGPYYPISMLADDWSCKECKAKDAAIAALLERCERLAREVKHRRHLAYTGKDRGVAYATRAVDDHKDLDAPPAAAKENDNG